jgi:hypothetical protein
MFVRNFANGESFAIFRAAKQRIFSNLRMDRQLHFSGQGRRAELNRIGQEMSYGADNRMAKSGSIGQV